MNERERLIQAAARACDAAIIDPSDPLATDAVRRCPAIVDAILAAAAVGDTLAEEATAFIAQCHDRAREQQERPVAEKAWLDMAAGVQTFMVQRAMRAPRG